MFMHMKDAELKTIRTEIGTERRPKKFVAAAGSATPKMSTPALAQASPATSTMDIAGPSTGPSTAQSKDARATTRSQPVVMLKDLFGDESNEDMVQTVETGETAKQSHNESSSHEKSGTDEDEQPRRNLRKRQSKKRYRRTVSSSSSSSSSSSDSDSSDGSNKKTTTPPKDKREERVSVLRSLKFQCVPIRSTCSLRLNLVSFLTSPDQETSKQETISKTRPETSRRSSSETSSRSPPRDDGVAEVIAARSADAVDKGMLT